jgi:hypothetical protein
MSFAAYAQAGFTAELLPIVPPNATVSVYSNHPKHIERGRGKLPGKRTSDGGWVGFGGWSESAATRADVDRWDSWNAGIGLQGRRFPGVDIDVDDPRVAERIELDALFSLGAAPTRFGRGARRLLPYRLSGAAKRRLVFTLPDRDGDTAGADSEDELGDALDAGGLQRPARGLQAVELLADGQQYLLEGIHPKTGQPYTWRDAITPATLGVDGLTEISPEQIDDFFERVEATIVELGGTIVTQSQAGTGGDTGQASLWAPSIASIGRALAAIPNDVTYDDWIKVAAAAKAAGGDEAYDLFEDWSLQWPQNTAEIVAEKWESLHAPFHVGWPWLSSFAREFGFSAAREEFGAAPAANDDDDADRAQARRTGSMFERCCYVEGLEVAFDLATLRTKTRGQLNAQFWSTGNPNDPRKSAWAIFMQEGSQRRDVVSLTYRPGGTQFVDEPGTGVCVNIWKKPTATLPATASDAQVQRWLDLVGYIMPDEEERETLLNWFARVVQNPGEKQNWGVLLGSDHQGVGKSIMLEPIRLALGEDNVAEIGPEELANGFNGWLPGRKLLIVEEMHSFGKTSTMNRLKALLAAPPWRLQVNPKFGRAYEVPNVLAVILFTNHPDALALEHYDRRICVLWTDVKPQPKVYYQELMAWYKAGGAALVARWLLDRDLTGFDALGQAPMTMAKRNMRLASRPLLDEWMEEAFEDARSPLAVDVVLVKDVWDAVPQSLYRPGQRPTLHKIGALLRHLGGVSLGRPVIGGERLSAFAIRNADRYTRLSGDLLAARIIRLRAGITEGERQHG